MVTDLAQVQRHERSSSVRTHPERPAGVQDEKCRPLGADPTENFDVTHDAIFVRTTVKRAARRGQRRTPAGPGAKGAFGRKPPPVGGVLEGHR